MIKKVAIDMDGVLVDFLAGAEKLGFYDPDTGYFNEEGFKEVDEHFWADLPPIVEGLWLYSRLYAFSKKHDLKIYILSHAVDDNARLGKKLWLEQNLNANPMDIVFVAKRRDKADFADKETVLIDDYEKNVEEFRAAKGNAVLFHRNDMKKTLEDLRVFLNEID